MPAGGKPPPRFADASQVITTFTYEIVGDELLAPGLQMPRRTPIADGEMEALMQLLGNFRTRLLWLHCEWAEAARRGRAAPAELAARAGAVFENLREQFVAHLMAALASCPTPVVVEPPPAGDAAPGAATAGRCG